MGLFKNQITHPEGGISHGREKDILSAGVRKAFFYLIYKLKHTKIGVRMGDYEATPMASSLKSCIFNNVIHSRHNIIGMAW